MQEQRQLERNVRERKRECMSLEALGDKEGFKQAAVKLKREQDKLKQFCANTGRTLKPDRTAVPGYGRSIAGKVTSISNENNILRKEKHLTLPKQSAMLKTSKEQSPIGSQIFSKDNRVKMLQQERIISGNSYETAIIYNSDGSIAFKRKGEAYSVTFTAEQIKSMKGKTLTHNHPGGGIPSPNDINIMRRGKLAELRTCSDNGAYVIRSNGEWSKQLSSLSNIKEEYHKTIEEVGVKYRDIAAREGKSIITYLNTIDEKGLELFCERHNLTLIWEDKT